MEGHIIKGILTDSRTGLPAGNIETYLSVPGKRKQFCGSTTDKNGRILFHTKDFFGPQEMVLQTNTTKDSLYRIDIASPFSDTLSGSRFPVFPYSPVLLAPLLDMSVGMQVQNIYDADKRNQFLTPVIDSTVFYHTPDKTYLLDDFTRFPTVEEVIREYVPEVAVRRRNGKRIFLASDLANLMMFESEPLVLLDGVPVFNAEKIFAYDPLKIRKLEVLSRRYFWGPMIFEGILSFTTYTNDLTGFQLDPSALIVAYEGLQLQRKFYSPVYETNSQITSRLPDLRNVLFWSPDVVTDSTGKKQISFYSSDQAGTYMGILQGITKDGQAGKQIFTFVVTGSM